MSKVYLFPGQGSQKVGMGEELFDRFADLTAQADEILGYSIKELCLEDPNEVLSTSTDYTQPALFVVSALSYLAKIEDGGEKPVAVAGHSLGEYNALFAAGAYDFATGLKLVQKRGALMSKAAGGGMAAVLMMPEDDIKAIINDKWPGIDVANFNSPNQIVISGLKDDIVNAQPDFEAAKRYVVLPVGGAFHSRYMKDSADEFKEFISGFSFNELECDVYANLTAQPYKGDEIVDNLVQQIYSSVRWVETIQNLRATGEHEYEEVGPGRVLAGLLRQS